MRDPAPNNLPKDPHPLPQKASLLESDTSRKLANIFHFRFLNLLRSLRPPHDLSNTTHFPLRFTDITNSIPFITYICLLTILYLNSFKTLPTIRAHQVMP
ncbi:hypothetical protein OSB04_022291 [Centaurea solstitialis]|uniref:Uncharacterized protein n=1 Tax=Centaurea solstitialis TaxID=347529 RepID=A0AA38SW39_9ASTR|nr:hypothetical protein OSB04_022291 [Centaurea solstitialis]